MNNHVGRPSWLIVAAGVKVRSGFRVKKWFEPPDSVGFRFARRLVVFSCPLDNLMNMQVCVSSYELALGHVERATSENCVSVSPWVHDKANASCLLV